MERLTSRSNLGCGVLVRGRALGPAYFRSQQDYKDYRDALARLAEYEDIGTPEEFLAFTNTGMAPDEYAKALKDLASAIATSTIFRHQYGPDRALEIMTAEAEGRLMVLPCKVGDKVYQTDGVRIYELTVFRLIFDTETIAFDERAIGESIFLTREEAEAALKEANGQ